MRRFLFILVGLMFLSVPTLTFAAGGEDCTGAAVIDLSSWTSGSGDTYVDSGNTDTALNDYGEGDYLCGSGLTSPDHVYSFTPPEDLLLGIDLCGSSFDTKIVITDGCPAASTVDECFYNDDYCSVQSGFDPMTFSSGVTYYIFIEGYNNATGDYELTIQESGFPTLQMAEDFSTGAPGWTLNGSWATGAATASSGCSGNQDPDVDYTGENNILGYAIGDCYANDMTATEYAVSPSFDFTGKIDVTLGFARWLGVESPSFDYATVEVSTDGGTTWDIAWENSSSVADTDWLYQAIDLSTFADNESDVTVRFGMGPTDISVAYCGWNLDYVGWLSADPGYIEGTVTDYEGPVAGAVVSFAGSAKTAVTNASGYYTIAMAPGTYDITVTADGHADGTATAVAIAVGATTTQNFTLETGYLAGTVSNAGGPLAGALVTIDTTGDTATTTASGAYSFQFAPGTYDMTVTALGHNDASATGVVVADGATTTQNFVLTAPEIDVTPLSHSVTLAQPATDTRTVTIANSGDGELTYNIGFSNFGESKAMWDVLATYDIEALTSDPQMLGCEYMNGSLWFTGANNSTDPNNLYQISADGTTLLNTYSQAASATDWGYRDLAHDGNYLYAGCGSVFYQIDPSDGSVVAEVTHSLGVVIRALAYNPTSGTFFTGDFSNDIYEFSFDGSSVTEVRSFSLGLSGKYGMAWDDASAGGPFLWIFDQSGTTTTTSFYQADVSTPGSETLTAVSYELPLQTPLVDQSAGGLFLSTDFVGGKIVLGGMMQADPTDTLAIVELGDFATWISPDVTTGTIAGGGSDVITLTFDSNEVVGPGRYTCDMNIASNDGDENPVTVDLEMIVTGGGTLSGTVTYGTGGNANGATVTISELGRTRTTNASGFYEFANVPAGTYTVTASLTNYDTDTVTGVVVTNSTTTTQDLVLHWVDIEVTPLFVYHWQPTDNTETETGEATVENTGSQALNWTAAVTYDPVFWDDVTPLGTAMQWPATTVYDGLLYCIGGIGDPSLIDNVQIYNPTSGTWSAGTAIPTPVFAATCVGYDDQIFVFGGFSDGSFTATDAVQIYDIVGDTWSTGTVMPTARGGNCGDVIGDYAYVVGGSSTSSFPTDNVCYQYDLINDTWTTLDEAPIPGTYGISLGGAVAHDGLLYAGGHYLSTEAGWNVLDPTQPTGSQWTALTAAPGEFGNMTPSFASVASLNGIVGFGAGYDWTSTGTTYLYNPVADTWLNMSVNMTVPAHGGAAGMIGDKLYHFGGTNGSLIDPPPFVEVEPFVNDWLSLSSLSGSVASLTSEDLDFTYDSTGLPDGNYDAYVTFSSNDTEGDSPVIHVDFDVADTQPTPRPIPATGPVGVGMLLLIIGTLIGVATIRKQ